MQQLPILLGQQWSCCIRLHIALSLNIQKQILQTDLHTFPSKISMENLLTDQIMFPLMTISLISHDLFLLIMY